MIHTVGHQENKQRTVLHHLSSAQVKYIHLVWLFFVTALFQKDCFKECCPVSKSSLCTDREKSEKKDFCNVANVDLIELHLSDFVVLLSHLHTNVILLDPYLF